jgi:hypothetical protein
MEWMVFQVRRGGVEKEGREVAGYTGMLTCWELESFASKMSNREQLAQGLIVYLKEAIRLVLRQ